LEDFYHSSSRRLYKNTIFPKSDIEKIRKIFEFWMADK